jgi:glycerophosphoryl diester phosphodiesterase
VQQRLPSKLDDPLLFAHRGARAYAPENTLEAFSLALTLGVNALESDVWLTADGHAVLDHDGVVRRPLRRPTPISEVRRADLPPHIPTLTELFEHCGTAFHLSLDLKDAASGVRVIEATRNFDEEMLPRLWLCSPRWQELLHLRGLGARLVDSTRLGRIKEGPERRTATLAAQGIDGLNMHHTDWNGGLVALCHRFDLCAFSWDLQEMHLLERALRMGLDGVFSDYPDRLVDAHRAQIGAVRPIADADSR